MTENEWKTYRTRFLIKAKQLNSNLSFTDALGRQHCGRKGDYLVESSDGVLSITPRQIFEDIYVAMGLPDDPSAAAPARTGIASRRKTSLNRLRFEPLRIERLENAVFDTPDEDRPAEG